MADLPIPDDKRLFLLLRKLGLDDEQAYSFVQELQTIAAASLIARFESKLDVLVAEQKAQLAAQSSKLDAQDSKLKMLMWMVGAAVAVIRILIRLRPTCPSPNPVPVEGDDQSWKRKISRSRFRSIHSNQSVAPPLPLRTGGVRYLV